MRDIEEQDHLLIHQVLDLSMYLLMMDRHEGFDCHENQATYVSISHGSQHRDTLSFSVSI
jgi:hypothetical protein